MIVLKIREAISWTAGKGRKNKKISREKERYDISRKSKVFEFSTF